MAPRYPFPAWPGARLRLRALTAVRPRLMSFRPQRRENPIHSGASAPIILCYIMLCYVTLLGCVTLRCAGSRPYLLALTVSPTPAMMSGRQWLGRRRLGRFRGPSRWKTNKHYIILHYIILYHLILCYITPFHEALNELNPALILLPESRGFFPAAVGRAGVTQKGPS